MPPSRPITDRPAHDPGAAGLAGHPTIHRRLLTILAAAAVAMSIVLGAATFLYELHHAERRIVALAQGEAAVLADMIAQHAEAGAGSDRPHDLRTALDARTHAAGGHFVAAELLSGDGALRARAGDAGMLIAVPGALPPSGKPAVTTQWATGEVRVALATPVPLTGGPMGLMRGVFQLGTAALAELADAVARVVAVTVAVVLITTGVLYPVILALHRTLLRRNRDLLDANISVLDVLGKAVAKRDSDTHTHNHRVTLYAVRLAEAAGLPVPAVAGLIKGALLHDVGKIGVSDAILLKPGRLTAEEFEVMKRHVGFGLEIVGDTAWLADAAVVIAAHHERWDGSGYPRGLQREDIPVTARVFAVADVFDALTSQRPYKDPLQAEQVVDMLAEQSGRHFDPRLVAVFLGICQPLFEEIARMDEAGLRAAVWRLAERYLTLCATVSDAGGPGQPAPISATAG